VEPIEAFRAADAPAAFYEPASQDGLRPAMYYINTHESERRPLYNLDALTFHEAVPGHHLQIALAQENQGLPLVRRHAHVSAFTEGWALYAERLSDELGLYATPEARFGMLNYQAWRAVRLVVDTGMHALGWSRQQAIDTMRAHLALPDHEIANEIDRYIIWPGQALAYMTGRIALDGMRTRALAVGRALPEVHDAILGGGDLPLEVLEARLEVWLQDQKGGAP
jgi:prolyl oligopeptidase